jgi:hypothetical protein
LREQKELRRYFLTPYYHIVDTSFSGLHRRHLVAKSEFSQTKEGKTLCVRVFMLSLSHSHFSHSHSNCEEEHLFFQTNVSIHLILVHGLVLLELTLEPHMYIILPTLFHAGKEGKFTLIVYATHDFLFAPI